MTTQEAFISRVRLALGRPDPPERKRSALPHPIGIDRSGDGGTEIHPRSPVDRLNLLKRLVERGKALNLTVSAVKGAGAAAAAITTLVEEKSPEWEGPKSVAAWPHPLIDALELAPLLSSRQVTFFTVVPTLTKVKNERGMSIRRRLETAFVGITSANYCLADTGTLVLASGPNQARAVSLLPTIHVAVIELEQVIGDLAELFNLLKSGGDKPYDGLGNCLSLITGPSKTADIELTMVHGAHGPRELYLYVIAPEAVE